MVVWVHTSWPTEMRAEACWPDRSPAKYLVTGSKALAVITPASDFVTVASRS